jgi:tetratricopeptide (TPR) repeat protein
MRNSHARSLSVSDALRSRWGGVILLALAVGIAYAPCIHNGFIWDDDANIFQNAALTEAGGLRRIWSTFDLYQYYPLTFTSFYLEHLLWGFNPLGYHVVSILLQAVNATLVLLLLQQIGLSRPLALFISMLFAIHPIQAESVAWATERKNLLSGLFYFSSFLSYARFINSGRYRLYILSLLLFLGAILAKSVTVTLPASLLLLEFVRATSRKRTAILRLVPFVIPAVLMGIIAIYMETNRAGAVGDEFSFTAAERILIVSRALLFYPATIALPFNMSFIYPPWRTASGAYLDFWPILLLAGITVSLWIFRKRIPRIAWFSLGHYLVAIAPATGIINFYFMRYAFVQNHFQYIAGLGMMMAMGIAGAAIIRRIPLAARAAGPAATLLVIAGCGLLTFDQCGLYRNNTILWNDTIGKNPSCWMAFNNLGVIAVDEGKIQEGIAFYQTALSINPHIIETHNNLGAAYMLQGMTDQAIAEYQQAVAINPNLAQVRANLGMAYAKKGFLNEAVEELKMAVELNPSLTEAFYTLGSLLERQGAVRAAIEVYRGAIRYNPGHHKAYNNLAWLYATSPDVAIRDGAQAVALATRACELTGFTRPETLDSLAAAYAEQGDFSKAVDYQTRALRTAPAPLKKIFTERLEFYQQGTPYRDH